MPRQLEFDFGEEFKNRNKIVEVCQSTGQGITQGEVDDYNAAAAAKRKSIQLEFDLEKEVSHVDKR
jgi:hypothetical protein